MWTVEDLVLAGTLLELCNVNQQINKYINKQVKVSVQ
jgi:hypothetical protein